MSRQNSRDRRRSPAFFSGIRACPQTIEATIEIIIVTNLVLLFRCRDDLCDFAERLHLHGRRRESGFYFLSLNVLLFFEPFPDRVCHYFARAVPLVVVMSPQFLDRVKCILLRGSQVEGVAPCIFRYVLAATHESNSLLTAFLQSGIIAL